MGTAVKTSLLCVLLLTIATHGKIMDEEEVELDKQELDENDEYFAEKRKRVAYYVAYSITNRKNCIFKEYAPNGPIKNVGEIKAPKATLGAKNALEAIIGKAAKTLSPKGVAVMHAIKFTGKLAKKLGNLGPALGLFSAMTNILFPSPTPEQLLGSVNKAINDLTDEVNKKLSSMNGYVDSEIARSEKKLIEKKYRKLMRFWGNCVHEVNAEDTDECQRDAVRDMIADKESFADNFAAVSGFGKWSNWQLRWNKLYPAKLANTVTSYKTVRSLEAYLLAFRDYVNLFVMAIVPLCQTYCETNKNAPDASKYCAKYTRELKNEATFFVKYAKDAVGYIKRGHWGKQQAGACINTVHCGDETEVREGFWASKKHTANRGSCWCEIESANTKKFCKIGYTRRMDGKHSYTRVDLPFNLARKFPKEAYGKKIIGRLARDYQIANHKVIDAYWNKNLLNFVSDWRKAIALADKFRKMNPLRNDAPEVDDETLFEPSPRYEARLAAATEDDI